MCADPRFLGLTEKDLENIKHNTHPNPDYNNMEYGICQSCGEETLDGKSIWSCDWSPVECKVCDYRPCDGSC